MNLMSKLLVPFFLFVLAPQISLAKKTSHKPSQLENPIKIKVLYGEKTTWFSIIKIKNKAQKDQARIEFSNNIGSKDSKEISLKDYNYLKTKISKIPGVSNNKDFCTRNYTTISFENKELVGCIGASNKFAREVQDIVNLISVLF